MLKIALLQILPGPLEKGIDACRKAKAMGADIALFPEMWSNGYQIPEDVKILKSMATPTVVLKNMICSFSKR